MADTHDNPKVVKMYELINSDELGKKMLRVVTYLRTNLIGWQKNVVAEERDDLIGKLDLHGHKLGVILEVGRLG